MNLEKIRFGNGAGTIKRPDEVERACKSAMTDVTIGSITLEERAGNTGDVYYYHPIDRWSLNTLGLPNPGLEAYLQILPDMRRRIHAAGKNMRVSVAGFSPKEYAILAEQCLESGADEIELNLGCPNVWGEGGQKPIPSYHPDLTAEILDEVDRAVKPVQVAAKISPVDDLAILTDLAYILYGSPVVYKIVATNTIPNQERLREDGESALNFNNGNHVGGLAGAPLLERALSVTYTLLQLIPDADIVFVGGIFTGADAMKGLRRGAMGFQCATAYIENGPRIFSDILEGLTELA